MVGPEERGKPQCFRRLRDRKLVGVTGALLRFNEYPKVHERQTMPRGSTMGSCAPPLIDDCGRKGRRASDQRLRNVTRS
jgi:hypothetical protein